MKNYKNYLIAILSGLLLFSLSTQQAQSAAKTYDAAKLVEYETCITGHHNWDIAFMQANEGNGKINWNDNVIQCRFYKP